jgi:hypothetical protein
MKVDGVVSVFRWSVFQRLALIRHTDISRDCVWLQLYPKHEASSEGKVPDKTIERGAGPVGDTIVSASSDKVGAAVGAANTVTSSPGEVIAPTSTLCPSVAFASDMVLQEVADGASPVPLASAQSVAVDPLHIVSTNAASCSATAVSEFVHQLLHRVAIADVATSSSSPHSCPDPERSDSAIKLTTEGESQPDAAAFQAQREQSPKPVIVEASVTASAPVISSLAPPSVAVAAVAASDSSNSCDCVLNGTRVRVVAVAALRGFAYVEVVSQEYKIGWVPQQYLQFVDDDLSLVESSSSSSSSSSCSSSSMATGLVDNSVSAKTVAAKPTAATSVASSPADAMTRASDQVRVHGNKTVVQTTIQELFLDRLHWQTDDQVSKCPKCQRAFCFDIRKHHCRICGRIFCDNCSKQQIAEQRVCDHCFDREQAQFKGYVHPQPPIAGTSAASAPKAESVAGVRFFAVGGIGHGQPYEARALGQTMAAYAQAQGMPTAILGLGNNISSTDDVGFRTAWIDPFLGHPELQVPWHMSLGPRDYLGDVQRQIDFTKAVSNPNGLWKMPARTYDVEYPGKSCPLTSSCFLVRLSPIIILCSPGCVCVCGFYFIFYSPFGMVALFMNACMYVRKLHPPVLCGGVRAGVGLHVFVLDTCSLIANAANVDAGGTQSLQQQSVSTTVATQEVDRDAGSHAGSGPSVSQPLVTVMDLLHNLSVTLDTDYTRFAQVLTGPQGVTSVSQLAALTNANLTDIDIPVGKAKQIIAAAKEVVASFPVLAPVSVSVASSTASARRGVQSPAVAALDAQLAASTATCKVVVGHHAVCTAVQSSGSMHAALRLELDAVLRKHGVLLYISGSDPVFQHHTRDRVHHVEVGGSAQPDATHQTAIGSPSPPPAPGSWVDLTDANGFLVVDVTPDGVELQFVSTFVDRPHTWLERRRESISHYG